MDDISLTNGVVIFLLVLVDAVIMLGYAALSNADMNDEQDNNHTETLKKDFAIGGQMSLVVIRFVMAVLAVDGVINPLIQNNPNTPALLFYIGVLLPLVLVLLIVGEITPAMVGKAYSNQIVKILRLPMSLIVLLLRPFIWLVGAVSTLVARLFGVQQVSSSVTEQEFLKLVENEVALEANERRMIHSVMQLDETTVSEMMVPRIDMISVDKATTIADARDVFLAKGHSRMPVYADNVDHIVGILYVKDLLEVWHNGDTVVGSVEEIMRPPHFIPETMTGDQLLRFFQRNKVHLAVVLEEYGGTGGLVTLEDLLEEIVGDIQDEYDEDEHEDVVPLGDGVFRVDASISLVDLNETLGLDIEDEEVDTLGGYVFKMLDRIPDVNEVLELETLEITVLSLEGRRIREVRVRLLPEETETPATEQASPAPETLPATGTE